MRSAGAPARRRGPIVAAVALALAAGAVALILPSFGAGQDAAPVTPQPVLGAADLDTVLMGGVSAGDPGEAWGYRRLPLDVPPPVVDGKPLRFAPVANPASPEPQLAFLRTTEATGWRVVETPVDATGEPIRGGVPNPLSARVTPRGGRPAGHTRHRSAGRRPGFRAAAQPGRPLPRPGTTSPRCAASRRRRRAGRDPGR